MKIFIERRCYVRLGKNEYGSLTKYFKSAAMLFTKQTAIGLGSEVSNDLSQFWSLLSCKDAKNLI